MELGLRDAAILVGGSSRGIGYGIAAALLVLGVAAYNLTRAAINEAAVALDLSPRQFSFSMARDTINAFLPRFAEARNEAERRQIGQQMLRVMSQSLLPRRRKRRPSPPRTIWPRPCSFPKRKVSTAGKREKGINATKKK